jgi:hypothetical protein
MKAQVQNQVNNINNEHNLSNSLVSLSEMYISQH